MELAIRAATSALTGTPAVSAIALISLCVGLVMRHLLPWPARGCGPNWPYSMPSDAPLYRAGKVLTWHARRAAPRTGNGCVKKLQHFQYVIKVERRLCFQSHHL